MDPPLAEAKPISDSGSTSEIINLRREVHGGANIHLQPVEDPTLEQENAPKGSCDSMESPCWSRLLAGAVGPWREDPTQEQVC